MNVRLRLPGVYLSAVLATYAMADLYAPESGVVELTSDTFERNVLYEDGGLWVVNFYAPWCPYSRNFTSEYSKAAQALKGFAKAGAFDCEQVNVTNHCNGVYPTVVIFFGDDHTRKFEGESPAVYVTNLVVETVTSMIALRLHRLYQIPANTTVPADSTTYSDPTTQIKHPAAT